MNPLPNIRITKQFRFEAAHALGGYDGTCKNIHGHSYLLYVTLIGKPINKVDHPKYGMVMDFTELKDIVYDLIIKHFDHSLLIKEDAKLCNSTGISNLIGKITPLPYQPTCENMVADFACKIKKSLPSHIKLHSIRLHETDTAYAEWYASDNPE